MICMYVQVTHWKNCIKCTRGKNESVLHYLIIIIFVFITNHIAHFANVMQLHNQPCRFLHWWRPKATYNTNPDSSSSGWSEHSKFFSLIVPLPKNPLNLFIVTTFVPDLWATTLSYLMINIKFKLVCVDWCNPLLWLINFIHNYYVSEYIVAHDDRVEVSRPPWAWLCFTERTPAC